MTSKLDEAKAEVSAARLALGLRRDDLRIAQGKLTAYARYYALLYREQGEQGAGTVGRVDDMCDAARRYAACVRRVKRAEGRWLRADNRLGELERAEVDSGEATELLEVEELLAEAESDEA